MRSLRTLALAPLLFGAAPLVGTAGTAGNLVVVVPGAAAARVDAVGGRTLDDLDALGQLVAEVPADAVDDLRAAGVPVAVDRGYEPSSGGFGESAVAGSDQVSALGLPPGLTGEGVGVALLDTGVSATAPLARRPVAGADVATGRGALRDGYGHGTFLAGLISGVDAPGRWDDVPGAAPGADVVSVRVADDAGATTLVDILEGVEWTLDNADQYRLRVLVLAFAAQAAADGYDPLHAALELAWASGLVVVVPAGNGGDAGVTSPGDDPWFLTVGAADGEAPASWSGRDDVKPEVLAPGTRVVSARVPGSVIDRQYPAARVSPRLFRGSGTSMATALTAAAAAVVVQDHPAATPDDVKGALVDSTERAAGGPPRLIDVATATSLEASEAWVQHHPVDELLGGGDDMPWSTEGTSWTGTSWTGTSWTGTSWTGVSWSGTSWTGTSWTGTSWTGTSWTGTSWTGTSWTGTSWTGTSWTGTSWTGTSWTGTSWTATFPGAS